ncbi:MAG: MopE-related protein [Myxococcota bacterium]|nr:MopE-related protein [Myxococcota bacterium]
MTTDPKISLLACLAFIYGALAPVPGGAEWRHSGGDVLGSGHVDGVGAISADSLELPAMSSWVTAPATDFSVSLFADVNGDGQVEVLRVFQERLGAFDIGNGSLLWLTPALGLTEVEGLSDTDGDGEEDEVVVSALGMGGGVYVIDLATGAVVGSFTDLVGGSGVRGDELALADVDGDGAEELVFASALRFTPELYVLDLSTPDGLPRVARGELGGYYLQLNRLVVGDFDGDGIDAEIVTLQADWLDLKRICSAGAPTARCDEVDGTVCVCDVALVEDAFAARIFPSTPRALDGDGDGADELLTVHVHSTHADGLGAVGLSSFFDGSAAPALDGWLYDYSALDPSVYPVEPEGPPRDLNGDGGVDLVVTLLNAHTGEVDLHGDPTEDGLDQLSAFSLGVFDGSDGSLLASMENAIAHGYVDFDGDGTEEIVVETSDGLDLGAGHVEGWELVCSTESCELTLAWSAPNHRITRFPSAWDGTTPPPRGLLRVDPKGAGRDSLLLWQGEALQHCEFDGSDSVIVTGYLSMGAEDRLAGVRDRGNEVLVNSEGVVTLYDGSLDPRSELPGLPSGAVLQWFAAQLDASVPGATSIIDGRVFLALEKEADLDEADIVLLENVALIADVDNDGLADIFATENSPETGAFTVKRYEYDPSGLFIEHWSWDTVEPTDYRPFEPRSLWNFATGDFDLDGVEDLVFSLEYYPDMALLYLDGNTGELMNLSWMQQRDAQYAPLAVGDYCSVEEGYGTPDGIPDVLRPSRLALEAWTFDGEAPEASRDNGIQSAHFAFADLDGDGELEAVIARLFNVIDPAIEAVELTPALTTMWGPVTDLEEPPAVEQAMAFARADDLPGDDLVLISSSGALDLRSGSSGERLSGFPLYFSQGELSSEPSSTTDALRAVIATDIDGDGYDEAIVASGAGYLYAVDIDVNDPAAPGLQWSWFGAAALVRLGAADVDGDGELEVLVSAADGTARVIDGLGMTIRITQPQEDDCLEATEVAVCGTSSWIDSVDIYVQGLPRAEDVEIHEDGSWCAEVSVPAVAGVVEIVAVGKSEGAPAASDQLLIDSNLDEDGDGVTLCGGDCDDDNPLIAPGFPELCDGLDNDCDPTTLETEDEDGDGASVCDGDCDDQEERASPIGIEACEDGIDNDCDGSIDAEDSDCEEPGAGTATNMICCQGCASTFVAGPSGPGRLTLLITALSALLFLRRRERC